MGFLNRVYTFYLGTKPHKHLYFKGRTVDGAVTPTCALARSFNVRAYASIPNYMSRRGRDRFQCLPSIITMVPDSFCPVENTQQRTYVRAVRAIVCPHLVLASLRWVLNLRDLNRPVSRCP